MLGIITLILICFILPLGAVLIAARKSKRSILIFLAGALSFFISQICIRLPILQLVLPNQTWFMKMSLNLWFVIIFYATTAGLFEGIGRQAGLMIACRKHEATWLDGVIFGFGHGGCEAILLVGINGIISYAESGNIISMTLFLASVERLCAITIHIVTSLLVLYGIKKHTWVYFAAAVGLHAFADGFLLLVNLKTKNIGWTMFSIVVIMVCYGIGVFLLRSKFEKEEDVLQNSNK